MAILDDVKLLLSIDDTQQDDLLRLIQRLTESHYKAYADVDEIPSDHDFIITEVMVKRFNRLGDEGVATKTIEGLSTKFTPDDFETYSAIINRKGKVIAGVQFL